MKLSLPDEVRRRTTTCPSDFACLSTGASGFTSMCEVERSLDSVLFLKPIDQKVIASCPYAFHYGNAPICSCPSRSYLYEQQRKIRRSEEQEQKS
jgi:hypothetical protein